MAKIMYIPLDERPCNYLYPQKIIKGCEDFTMLVPSKNMLGEKKKPADVDALWAWVESNITGCTHLIASIDMLMYGGIVPSRLHYLDNDTCGKRLERLAGLKKINPGLNILAFNLIMRVPSYNSSDEEPDYYEEYGMKIFKYSWFYDKVNRQKSADQDDLRELEAARAAIPEDVLNDYVGRRKVNSYVNMQAVKMAEDGLIDFLVLPLDDCAKYGFSANEQHNILKYVEKHNIHDKVYMYPGADEVGCTLTARVLNDLKNRVPRVYTRFSSTAGPMIIPRLEDRVLGESIKSQIIAAGGIPVDNSLEADFILMVNSPAVGENQMNGANEDFKDASYYSMRNLREFVAAMKYYLENGKKCALADVALLNGSDAELLRMLSKGGLLRKLLSYAGWNTSGNTLGTVISHAMARLYMESDAGEEFYVERLVEDWGYQADLRQVLRRRMAEDGLSMESDMDTIKKTAKEELNRFIAECLPEYKDRYYVAEAYFPWRRLFEIGFVLEKR